MLRSGLSVHVASPRRLAVRNVDNKGCASIHASHFKLPSQVLARTIEYWTMAISHVQLERQFKLLWPRQCIPPYLGLQMIEVHQVDVK